MATAAGGSEGSDGGREHPGYPQSQYMWYPLHYMCPYCAIKISTEEKAETHVERVHMTTPEYNSALMWHRTTTMAGRRHWLLCGICFGAHPLNGRRGRTEEEIKDKHMCRPWEEFFFFLNKKSVLFRTTYILPTEISLKSSVTQTLE